MLTTTQKSTLTRWIKKNLVATKQIARVQDSTDIATHFAVQTGIPVDTYTMNAALERNGFRGNSLGRYNVKTLGNVRTVASV